MLPRNFDSTFKKSNTEELLKLWLDSSFFQDGNSLSMQQTQVTRKNLSGVSEEIKHSGHLLIIMPICLKLCQCKHGNIRAAACEVASTVDMASLVSSFTDLLARAEFLEVENERLETELWKTKSVAGVLLM